MQLNSQRKIHGKKTHWFPIPGQGLVPSCQTRLWLYTKNVPKCTSNTRIPSWILGLDTTASQIEKVEPPETKDPFYEHVF
jgi:hypothetical protein